MELESLVTQLEEENARLLKEEVPFFNFLLLMCESYLALVVIFVLRASPEN